MPTVISQPFTRMKTALALFLCALNAAAAEPKFEASVRVTIHGDDSVVSEMESYTKRELRSLGDVRLTDDEQADFTIFLHAEADTLTSGRTVGYVVSVLVTEPLKTNSVALFVSEPKFREAFGDYVKVDDFGTVTGPNLREVCSKIVTGFDSRQLEHSRSLFELVKKMVEENQRSKALGNDVPAWTNTVPAGPP